MILLNSFYKVLRVDHSDRKIEASVHLNKEHAIFAGHFPGTPIVPGVCMMQMVKEIMETVTREKVNLTSADNMKFLAMLNPAEHEAVNILVDYERNKNEYQIKASILAGPLTFFKLNATLQLAG